MNDQPSILTVCLPGIGPECTPDELEQILAARERTLPFARAGVVSGSNSAVRAASTASCDDSACGIDALVAGSIVEMGRLSEVGSARLQQAEAGSGVGTASGCTPSFFHADSGKKALELLRMLRFDLLVTGDVLPDMPVSQLIRRVRVAWPWQKWAMVGAVLTAQDEIAARSLGAIAVFDAPPDLDAIGSLASAVAGKAAETSNLINPSASARVERADAEPVRSMRLAGDGDRSRSLIGESMTTASARESGNRGRTRRKAIAPQSLRRKVSDRSVG